MTTPTMPIPPSDPRFSPAGLWPQPPQPDPRRRSRRTRRTVAVVATGGLLAGVAGLAVATSVTSSSASGTTSGSTSTTQFWSYGRGSTQGTGGSQYGGSGADPWGDGSTGSGQTGGSQTGTQNGGTSSSATSITATRTQSKGVAVIDTVLSDGEAAGTGIVLTSNGEILTNYHVVEQSTSIRVTIASTGKTYTATVVGDDPTKDVALLQLKQASGLTVAAIDDDDVALGATVTAVGNAGGTNTLTAATGTITGLAKSITTEAEASAKSESLKGLLETNAGIVAGDSGGPLLDAQGEVTGIDTAASSGGQADGYAIPIATALKIVSQIQSGDETTSVRIGPAAFLGIELATTDQTDGASGATVAGVVAGDAAARAGLSAGDVITKVGSKTVSSSDALSSLLAAKNPGDRVKINWTTTSGHVRSATVTLGTSPIN